MVYTISDYGIALGFKIEETRENVTLCIQHIIAPCYKCSMPLTGNLIFPKEDLRMVQSVNEYFCLDPSKPKYMVELQDGTINIQNTLEADNTNIELEKICEKCGEFVVDKCCGVTYTREELVEQLRYCKKVSDWKTVNQLGALLLRFPEKGEIL